MKQFNLEEYLANPSRKLVTKGGINVRIICTDRLAEYPVVALLYFEENEGYSHEQIVTYTRKGHFNMDFENSLDLFFAPEKKEGWINIFKTDIDMLKSGRIYNSKTEAKESVVDKEKYVDTVKIEWEE